MNRLVYALLLVLCLFSCTTHRTTNWSVGLLREGRNPYDLYLGYHALAACYPGARISLLSGSDALSRAAQQYPESKSLMVLVGKSIQLSARERAALEAFAERGNELVLFSGAIDAEWLRSFGLSEVGAKEADPLSEHNPGSANLRALALNTLPDRKFGIFGRNLRGYFAVGPDTVSSVSMAGTVRVGGRDLPNVCRISLGEGHITLVATPLILSNYFLLQPDNRVYFQALLQLLGARFDAIYWGSYQHRNPDISGWQLLMRHAAVRWAVLLFLVLSGIYLLTEARRKQRLIPEMAASENSYASFVETVGMLYYHHHDNANLCRKLEQHFLEWVRLRYRLHTEILDEHFVDQLSGKSGVDRTHTQHLIQMIHELHIQTDIVSDRFLFDFYTAIHVFYKINAQDGNRT